jgi:NAD(P)-dependent dehydrogenase (short-subunit alcohol dehydrogenase family)
MLKGKNAVITGSTSGIGLGIAEGFAKEGINLILNGFGDAAEIEKLRAGLASKFGVKVTYDAADMSKPAQIEAMMRKAAADHGGVDILINNAGSNIPQGIDKITDEAWDQIVELNLNSCMVLTRALVPQMRTRKWGRVIHISSIMGLGSKEGRNSYSATKSALIGMCRATALDVGADGITVNCIAPGPFLTDLPGSVLSAEEKQVFAGRTALGRWGDPQEVAGPALLLASDAGSYITGAVLLVDGGTMAKIF